MLNRISRLILMARIYALDITIAGQTECLECVASPNHKQEIEIARSNARRERTRLRVEYNALLPVGQRRIWKMA